MKFNYFFAVQYQQCFIYFGIPYDTSVAETGDQVYSMCGCVATLIEVDKEDSYIWSYMPQLCVKRKNIKANVKLYGGYVCGDRIKFFGIESGYRSWVTSLTELKELPQWSEITWPQAPYNWYGESLITVQQCEDYVIYFYANGTFEIKQEEECTSFIVNPDTVELNRYVNFSLVGADMFIINKNKMAKVEKFYHLLVANKLSSFTKQFHAVNFNIDVPHANGTLFCVQGTLCVIGGCDKDYDPFSDIHQFDQGTQEWKLSGFSSVSCFGASVVVFKGKSEKEAIFLAGGFKGKDTPCSIIEKLSVTV